MNNLPKIKKRVFIEDVITMDTEKLDPCLVSFDNGNLIDSDRVIGSMYRNSSVNHARRRRQRILKADSEFLSYTGKNFGKDSKENKNERVFLGVLNKKTNKMKLIEMSQFNLQLHLNEEEKLVDDKILTWHEKQKQLSDAFGGKMFRTKLRKREENKLNFESMNDALHMTMRNVNAEGIDLNNLPSNNLQMYQDILPPCNRDAEDLHDVYSLNSIISDEELLVFNEKALEILNEDGETRSALVQYIIRRAKEFGKGEAEQCKLICIALYIDQLTQVLQMTVYGNKLKNKLKNCPEAIHNNVMSFIKDRREVTKSEFVKDRLFAYIVILALLGTDYSFPMQDLVSSLNVIKMNRIELLLPIIGTSMNKEKTRIFLKVPLPRIPTYSGIKKSKRRQ